MLKNGAKDHNLTAAEQRKGGRNSVKARREKKTVRLILDSLMNTRIDKAPANLQKLAAKLGIDSTKNVKELFTFVCMMNSLKAGDFGDLEKLTGLLGEHTGEDRPSNNGILDDLAKYLNGKKTEAGDENA